MHDRHVETDGDYWRGMHLAERGSLRAVGHRAPGESFNRATYRLRLAAARRILADGAGHVSRILEAGVGVGAYAPLWAEMGVGRWVGVDISPAAIDDLRARFPTQRFEIGDVTKLDLQEEGFDLVTAIDLLFHVGEDQDFASALTALGTRVRPGGWLLVSDVFTQERRRTAAHVVRRPLDAYVERLGGLGFVLVRREAVFAILDNPVPRHGMRPVDHCLHAVWRVLAGTWSRVPAPARERLGGAVVAALTPLDRLLRRLGLADGVNLELALFRRAAG